MRRQLLVLVSALGFVAGACDSGNPVAPPPPGNGNPGTSDSVTVTVSSDRSQLQAGTSQVATLTVTARKGDGSAVEGEAVLNTSLGSFGLDDQGQPMRLVRRPLAGGTATAQLFPGGEPGTANVMAQVGTATHAINLSIVVPPPPPPSPVADFTMEVSGLSVLFTDVSTGDPTSWSWRFGDGTTSTEQSPLHTYPAADTYTVSLTVRSDGGESNKRKFVTVEAGLPVQAAFTFDVQGLTVLFTDMSAGEPVSWTWDFGDGGGSLQRNPSHTYARPGTYTVTLTIANKFGVEATASRFVNPSLGSPPQTDFQFQADGLRVLFTDTSTGAPTRWAWDFGDGSVSSAQNPSHIYSRAGNYSVTLTATNAAGAASKSKFVTVSLGDPPQAAFDVQVNGLFAVFTDRSTGKPTSWSWDFGECSGGPSCRSTEQSPSYTYTKPGTYTVILTASNAAGSSRITKLVTVGAAAAPVAGFCFQRSGLSVIFTDTSTQSPTAWQWDFGDCGTNPPSPNCKSTAQNPGHTYLAAGTFAATLTATNSGGASTQSKFVQVDPTISDPAPVCP